MVSAYLENSLLFEKDNFFFVLRATYYLKDLPELASYSHSCSQCSPLTNEQANIFQTLHSGLSAVQVPDRGLTLV